MNEQAFITLEYPQLLELLKRGAQTRIGESRAETLAPIGELPQLQRELRALGECVTLRNRRVSWSFSEFDEPGEAIGRLRVEGTTLDPSALLHLARLCEQALSARVSIQSERETAPILWQLVESLPRDLNTLVEVDLPLPCTPEMARIGNGPFGR